MESSRKKKFPHSVGAHDIYLRQFQQTNKQATKTYAKANVQKQQQQHELRKERGDAYLLTRRCDDMFSLFFTLASGYDQVGFWRKPQHHLCIIHAIHSLD